MDTMAAFARGLANRDNELKVFDWIKAALIIGSAYKRDVVKHERWEDVEAIVGLIGIVLFLLSVVVFAWRNLP